MAVAKEQIRQILSENNINSVYIHASERQFQGYPAGADGGRTGCNSWLREKPEGRHRGLDGRQHMHLSLW